MTGQEHLDWTLNDIEEHQEAGCTDGRTRFMLACLSQIRHRLPTLAEQALVLAEQYATGNAPSADVIQMRAECWRQLRGHEMETDNPSVCALRAVICALYTPEDGQQHDLVDLLSFFLGLLNRIEPHYTEQARLLRQCFPNVSTDATNL
jgi:hypothetical protein